MNEYDKTGAETLLTQLGALGEDDLKEAVRQIATAIGANESQIRAVTGDMARVKGILGGIGEKDLRQMEAKLGKESLQKLQQIVKETRKGE